MGLKSSHISESVPWCISTVWMHHICGSIPLSVGSFLSFKTYTYWVCVTRHSHPIAYVLRLHPDRFLEHYSHVILGAMVSQPTVVSIVCLTVCSGADQRKHQSSASLAFVRGTTGDRWIPLTKDQYRGKCFHLMTSPCYILISDHVNSIRNDVKLIIDL